MIEVKGNYKKCFEIFRYEFGVQGAFSINIDTLRDIAKMLEIDYSELKDKRGWFFVNKDNEIFEYAKDDYECVQKNDIYL